MGSFLQLEDRFRQDALDHIALVEEQPGEERQIQLTTGLVRRRRVQRTWLVEQADVGLQDLRTDRQLDAGLFQPLARPLTVDLDLPQSCVDLLSGQSAVRCQVQQPLLFDLEFAQLPPEAVVEITHGLLLVPQNAIDQEQQLGQKLRSHPLEPVVPSNRVLDELHGQVRQGADPILAPSTEVVAVDDAAATLRFDVDQPASSTCLPTAVAEEQSL